MLVQLETVLQSLSVADFFSPILNSTKYVVQSGPVKHLATVTVSNHCTVALHVAEVQSATMVNQRTPTRHLLKILNRNKF